MQGVQIVCDFSVCFKVVTNRGVGPIPRPPIECLVECFEVFRLLFCVEGCVISVVIRTAVVARGVRVGLVCVTRPAAGLQAFAFVLEVCVVERGETMAIATAEFAERALGVEVHLYIHALAVWVHAVLDVICASVVVELM